ncbi:MAG TPA: peptidoglycan-binding domain-containing protein, partial [Chthoniobacterales bacterium]|nr:peptidoglycan-binding domain-containing protein [Chthoniobacterales bacterium]
TGLVRADQTIAEVQQALKEQGFYYGEISGEKTADTTAAIRRYQIRNGLQVTGELNDETVKSLRSVPTTSSPPPVTTATAAPANTPQRREQTTEETEPSAPAPPQPYGAPSQDRSATGPIHGDQFYPPGYPPGAPNAPIGPPPRGELFADTPYATAPPDVQRDIVIAAERALAGQGFYHGDIDGVYGPALEFSLRAYQSRVRLAVTGRLDLETLAALELLPGAHTPVYRPRRRLIPPVRGEWIRP